MPRSGNPKAWSVLVLSAALAACLVAAVLAATGPADAAPRFKTVTRTFQNPGFLAVSSVGPANPYPSEIAVGGLKRGKVLDANLTLKNFGHAFPSDVDVVLSHRGVDRTVFSDVGAGGAGDVTLGLDDEAAGPLLENALLGGGAFRPTNIGAGDFFAFPGPQPGGASELSGFDGSNPNGPWRLWVMDDTAAGAGQFAGGWSVTIKARVLR